MKKLVPPLLLILFLGIAIFGIGWYMDEDVSSSKKTSSNSSDNMEDLSSPKKTSDTIHKESKLFTEEGMKGEDGWRYHYFRLVEINPGEITLTLIFLFATSEAIDL